MGFGRRGADTGKHKAEVIALSRAASAGERAANRSAGAAVGELTDAKSRLRAAVREHIGEQELADLTPAMLAKRVSEIAADALGGELDALGPMAQRGLVTAVLNEIRIELAPEPPPPPTGMPRRAFDKAPAGDYDDAGEAGPSSGGWTSDPSRSTIEQARDKVQPVLIERIDVTAALNLPRAELSRQVGEIVMEILQEEKLQLNQIEQRSLVTVLLNEMLGLGPLEPLLTEESVTDILVNGPKQIYVERAGKLELTDVEFRDNRHVMNIATRIVSLIGRRIDESSPLCDARLQDGSRVNIIVPPLAIDGPSISIRKFAKKKITLDSMEQNGNMSPAMAGTLRIAARAQLNILISGGTGSGKTTLLNALSRLIDVGERIVTIEDAAELQLQQPHVVRLETRPPNLEGQGEITMRDLVKNALRMRPDRIILGEVRGSEAVDMLQAMNTGHEGSMSTVHANRTREALTRLENMFGMAGINLPAKAIRTQIAAALDMIIQVSRMRDGVRRITQVTEVVGMEGDVITTQDLFTFVYDGEDTSGRIVGHFEFSGVRPNFAPKAEYFGLERALTDALQ